MRDGKVIPDEERVTQLKLIVCDARIGKGGGQCKNFVLKRGA